MIPLKNTLLDGVLIVEAVLLIACCMLAIGIILHTGIRALIRYIRGF